MRAPGEPMLTLALASWQQAHVDDIRRQTIVLASLDPCGAGPLPIRSASYQAAPHRILMNVLDHGKQGAGLHDIAIVATPRLPKSHLLPLPPAHHDSLQP